MDDLKFFNKAFVHDYKNILRNRVIDKIEKMTDEKFAEYDNETLINYFFNSLDLNPLIIHDKDAPDIKITKRIDEEKRYNSWYGYGIPKQPEYWIDRVENLYFNISVRLTGNSEFAFLRPSTYTGSLGGDDYENINLNTNNKDDCSILTVTLKKSVNDAGKIEDIKEAIHKEFLGCISLFEKNLNTVNSEVMRFKNDIIEVIKRTVEGRKKHLSITANVFKQFSIPLNSNNAIKFAQPLTIHKRNMQLPSKPQKQETCSFYIKQSDVDKINELIYNYLSSMERTPKTYVNSDENDIRNSILAILNTQYSNATGETFSNHGKTDIFIGKYGAAAYIAECKIWKGEKVFHEAIDQLISYTTYKECKGTLLFFNKTNKDFNRILENLLENIKNYKNFTSLESSHENIFHFTVLKEDGSKFPIQLMIFNFYYNTEID